MVLRQLAPALAGLLLLGCTQLLGIDKDYRLDAGAGSDGGSSPVCASDAVFGNYCDGDKVSGGENDKLYRCSGPGATATVIKTCNVACVVAVSGQDDYCQ